MNSIPIIGGPLDGTDHEYRTRPPSYLTNAGQTMGTVKGDRMRWQAQVSPERATRSGYVMMRVTDVPAYIHTSILVNYISRGER